ncbi:MAG: biopolymer transporter ExbD [Kiritimatiellae bacterium]|nr:biopolymer transporter ExbD [Kiritimatiellia bacterium]
MRKLTAQWGSWRADGLRMRFRPRSRIGQPFLQVVPWVSFVIVMLLFLLLSNRMLLRPGVGFDLPRAAFREGSQSGVSVVMVSAQRPDGDETLVFLDNVRYRLSELQQVEQLRAELGRAALRPDGRQLLLLADRHVPHGDVIAFVDLARGVGVQRVNVSIKPE